MSIQKLHQHAIRGKLYGARMSTVHFCQGCTVRSIKCWGSWFATGYHALTCKRVILKKVRKLVRYRLPCTHLQESYTEKSEEVWFAAGCIFSLFWKLHAGCSVGREPCTDNSTYADWISICRLRHVKRRTSVKLLKILVWSGGTQWHSWLRHYTTSQKVTGSISRWCHWNFSFT
jgi:hypothetical protein